MILCEECGVSAAPRSFSQVLNAGYMAGKVCIADENSQIGGYISTKAAFTCPYGKDQSSQIVVKFIQRLSVHKFVIRHLLLISLFSLSFLVEVFIPLY